MKKRTALVVGFFTAPLISALIGAALTPITRSVEVVSIFGLLPLLYFFSFLTTLLFGVPAFFMLLRLRLIAWWSTIGAGAGIGAVVAIIVRLPDRVCLMTSLLWEL